MHDRVVAALLRKLLDVAANVAAPPPKLVDVNELAGILSMSPRKVEELLTSGRLPEPIRLGRARRWVRMEIESWIAEGCPPASTWKVRRHAKQTTDRLNQLREAKRSAVTNT
jgi:predicted DNA-binding transcriptional regulator AlpA